jgi:hypothetical protein
MGFFCYNHSMNRTKLVWLFLAIGSTVGGFIPSLWDSGLFSISGVIGSAVGGFLGIYLGWKLGE